LTLTGPGGVGKTRLALTVAESIAGHFVDGVFWVNLAPLTDPTLVAATVAAALNLPEAADLTISEVLTRELRPRQTLIILDNCEHVAAETADLLAMLFAHCPDLQVLATSRVALGLSDEQSYSIPSLALPDAFPRGTGIDLATAERSAAVQLFVARAQAVRPEFTLTERNAAPVAAICQRLDGLPLALELAAARIRHLAPPQLLERLAPRLRLLTDGPRDQPRRLQTMRDAIAWSYDLLTPAEQSIFRCLAVFVGGFTLEAAEAVIAASHNGRIDSEDVFASIGRLLDQSLLYRFEADTVRICMLETIREFASDLLSASDEEAAIHNAHAAYFITLTESADPERSIAQQRVDTRPYLDADLDNVRAALAWLSAQGEGQLLLRLAASATWIWNSHSRYREGISWVQQALAMSDDSEPAVRIHALQRLAAAASNTGQFALADAVSEESLALARAHGDLLGIGHSLMNLAVQAGLQGDRAREGQLHQQALVAFRASENPYGIAHVLSNLGDWAYTERDYSRAECWSTESLTIARTLNHPWHLIGGLSVVAQLDLERGSAGEATSHYLEMASLSLNIGDEVNVAACLSGLAGVALLRRDPETATRWLAAAQASLVQVGSVTIYNDEQFARAKAAARAMLSRTRHDAAWFKGGQVPLRTALAEAVKIATIWQTEDDSRPTPSPAAALGLSPREIDVLRLVVAGRSDPEIAAILSIGRRTVQSHVSSMLKKLQVGNRTEAAAVAARDCLI